MTAAGIHDPGMIAYGDYTRRAGEHALRRLIDRADVVIEGFRPGVAERLGLGPDEVLSRNPSIVYARLTGYGSFGQVAFFGIGAYTSAILMHSHGWQFLPTLLVAAPLCFFVGVLIGFPALRLKGLYLALVTLGLAVVYLFVVTVLPTLARQIRLRNLSGAILIDFAGLSPRRRASLRESPPSRGWRGPGSRRR